MVATASAEQLPQTRKESISDHLRGTKMACQGDLPGYNWTQQVSDQYLSYHLLDGVLTLIKDEQELARFKHFD